MYRHLQAFQVALQGVEPIDFYLAQQICNALSKTDDELLFHSIVATSEALRQGHTCLNLPALAEQTLWRDDELDKPGVVLPSLDEWSTHLEGLNIAPDSGHPLVFENDRLYLRRYWQFETEVAMHLNQLLAMNVELDLELGRNILDNLFPPSKDGQDDANELDWQKVAVANALGRAFTVIAGGPGTGKTYTVTRLLVALQQLNQNSLKISLVAPTGKAAQRLGESIQGALIQLKEAGKLNSETFESIPDAASTLHRLLGVRRDSNNFRHDEKNPLSLDLLLVDEVSMIDLPLMARLMRAMPTGARLIMLGDADQLPSVAAGSVLADLAPKPHKGYSQQNSARLKRLTGYPLPVSETAQDHLTLLIKSRRFEGEGGIGLFANRVIAGDAKGSWDLIKSGGNQLELVEQSSFIDWLMQLVHRYYLPVLQAESIDQAFRALSRFRFLTGTRVGPTGVEQLNILIEDYLRTHGYIDRNTGHYPGRPIMVTENHYGIGLFNGDIGLLWRNESGRLLAAFQEGEDGIRWVSPGRLPRVESVYAMTIHKTQGSEFEHVVMILPDKESMVFSRELLYTGITRASKRFTLRGDESVWGAAIDNRMQRYSGLQSRFFSI